jgi:hypothetical protein
MSADRAASKAGSGVHEAELDHDDDGVVIEIDGLIELLEEQYQATLHYSNTSTALYNALQQQQQGTGTCTTSSSMSVAPSVMRTTTTRPNSVGMLRRTTEDYVDSLQQLQACMKRLGTEIQKYQTGKTANVDSISKIATLSSSTSILDQHVDRSHRILATIATQHGASFHANGIPYMWSTTTSSPLSNSSSNDANVKLVALATLRASIQIVKDHLSNSAL